MQAREGLAQAKEAQGQLPGLRSQLKGVQKQLAQAHQDYESLKMARMIEVSDGDVEAAKKRIAGLIREVNKCITLLSEQQ